MPDLHERRVRTWPQPDAPRLNDTPRGGRPKPRQSSGSGRIASAAVKASPSQAHRRTAAALRRFSGQRALAGASPALAPEMPSCSNSPNFTLRESSVFGRSYLRCLAQTTRPSPLTNLLAHLAGPLSGSSVADARPSRVVPTVQGSLSPGTTIDQFAARLFVLDAPARSILRRGSMLGAASLIEVHVGRSDIGTRERRCLGTPHPLKWKPTQQEGER